MTAFSVRLKGMVWICPLPNGAYHSLSLEGYAVDPALMPALLNLLEAETEPGVRVVLDHWLFGYIHPYPDGNGRMARFLMNVMLASGGWPTFAFFEAMKKPRIKILTRFGCQKLSVWMAYKRRLRYLDTFQVTRKIGPNSSDRFFHSFKKRKGGPPSRDAP
jgi:Fic family protein